jgi:hypothetical protein
MNIRYLFIFGGIIVLWMALYLIWLLLFYDPRTQSGIRKPLEGNRPAKMSKIYESQKLESFNIEFSAFDKDLWATRLHSEGLLDRGGVVEELSKNKLQDFLCHLGDKKHCQERYIAEVIDRLVAFEPIYAVD